MTYFATHTSATMRRKLHMPLSTGFETEADARAQAEFLAGYGGVVSVSNSTTILAKFSVARGWH